MREILFRGERLDNGEWKYGSYVYQYGCHEILLERCEGEYGFDHYSVDPATVGQYTGLKDKHGKRIFEGDIVTAYVYEAEYENEYLSNTPIKVTWCSGYFFPFYLNGCWRSGVSDIEIIGNIHDNPELLKKG